MVAEITRCKMGIFDSFIKQDNSQNHKSNRKNDYMDYSAQASANSNNMPANVQPTSFEDVYRLLDELRLGKPIIVDCSKLKQTTAIRVIDILSGATYCLNGGWKAVAPEIFMFAPNNAFSSSF